MRLYDNYLKRIQNVIQPRDVLQKGLGSTDSYFTGSPSHGMQNRKLELNENQALEPQTDLRILADLMGIREIHKPIIGDHPDFVHLRQRKGFEYHYITSVFIDVQGSTNLHKKYDLEQIYTIIQTVLLAATHTCALFGGHIQRIQGDGVFAYFGRRGVDKATAVKSAIHAVSFFSYFIKYELKEVFALEGIEEIFTRVGVDFGDDAQVQWAVFGSGECTELTTNSLHTSLAPKMQSCARQNGIMVGQHVKDRLNGLGQFCDLRRNQDGTVDETCRYIYRDQQQNFNYTQYEFHWTKFLSTFSFVTQDEKGNLRINYASPSQPSGAKEQQRLNELLKDAAAVTNGTAYINRKGNISTSPAGIHIPSNRFYYNHHANDQ